MKAKLFFASTVTLGILFGFVLFVFLLIAYFADLIDWPVLIALTVLMNALMLFISPMITDWMQRLFYKLRWVNYVEFETEHAEVARFMKGVCEKHKIKIPKLRVIDDANPTAYCYGSYPNNARLVLSQGIFKYLSVEEQKAVVAHELGHICNWDFVVMTIAATLLEVLYEVYWVFLRARKGGGGGKKKDITPLIGLVAYVLYLIGQYVILYLSRTREYLADNFSAEHTGNPDALSMALVKIAYGIAVEEETESTQRLLASTRSMGVYDFKAAHSAGSTFKIATGKDQEAIASELTRVFLFDFFSPWAFFAEVNSTHPLVGKRIKMMSLYAKNRGITSMFDFNRVEEAGKSLDRGKLYGGFANGVAFGLLPTVAAFAGLANLLFNPFESTIAFNFATVFFLVGTAQIIKGFYRFGRRGGAAEEKTVLELMQDPYANPMRGRYVEVEGKIIGKADAGSYFGEDVKMHDRGGGLIYLNYESIIPGLGNVFFGLTKAKEMIGSEARARGWFRRSSYQVIDLDRIDMPGGSVKSYTRFWGIITGVIFIIAGLIIDCYFGYSSAVGDWRDILRML